MDKIIVEFRFLPYDWAHKDKNKRGVKISIGNQIWLFDVDINKRFEHYEEFDAEPPTDYQIKKEEEKNGNNAISSTTST